MPRLTNRGHFDPMYVVRILQRDPPARIATRAERKYLVQLLHQQGLNAREITDRLAATKIDHRTAQRDIREIQADPQWFQRDWQGVPIST